jgi:hypothetical protein
VSVDTENPPTTDVAIPTQRETATYNVDNHTIVIPTPVGGMTLEFREGQRTLDAKQMHLLSPLGIEAGWDPNQVAVFLLDCNRRGFDPWANESYLMLYPKGKYIRHIGIAGFRRKGEETGLYKGRIAPEFSADGVNWSKVWLNKNVPPAAARCAIIRADHDEPDWGYAVYDEFAPMQDEYTGWGDSRKKTGRRIPVPMWRSAADGGKPSVMLGKVAEAIAWRTAFPNRFNGFYAPEEFDRQRYEVVQDDEATARRKAAYEAAQDVARPTVKVVADVIDGEATETTPQAAASGFTVNQERELLLAELDEQAEVLGKTVAQMSARWSASHGERRIMDASASEVRDFVHQWRPYVLRALRDANRDTEADRYAQAPQVADCHTLFGRGPAVVEPPTGAGVTEYGEAAA